jgi:uncharacterized integral membrane protein
MEPTGVDEDAIPGVVADPQEQERGVGPSSPPEAGRGPSEPTPRRNHTRLSATWTGVVAALIVLVVLIVFIAENTQHSTVTFFGQHGSAPVAVLLLIAAVAGALIVVMVGAARLLQLRLADRRVRTAGASPRPGRHGASRRRVPTDRTAMHESAHPGE